VGLELERGLYGLILIVRNDKSSVKGNILGFEAFDSSGRVSNLASSF
jgi:hypothetical protein